MTTARLGDIKPKLVTTYCFLIGIISLMSKQRTNQEWLQDLGSSGEGQVAAIEELRSILLRTAMYTFHRNLGDLAQFSQLEIQQLAEDCAQEALIALLKHLHDFRGESKFTTWAYKFAVNIALTMARRERWKSISLDDLDDIPIQSDWPFVGDHSKSDPDLAAMRGEMWKIIRDVIVDELTEKQRLVLKWMVFDDVPMDVVVERVGTNRNAVYKLLHDARSKLKRSMLARGIGINESIDLFSARG